MQMINEQFSLMQLVVAVLSSGILSSGITFITSRKQNLATVDETIRKTYGEMITDLRGQISFLNDQIKTAQVRELSHLEIIAQQNGTVSSIQAELAAGQLYIRNLETQKHKLESKMNNYEDILKRSEARAGV